MSKENMRVLILSEGKLYGPFVDRKATGSEPHQTAQDIANAWLENKPLGTQQFEMYSVWDSVPGTADKVHECGILLQGIEDSETTSRHSRRAASA